MTALTHRIAFDGQCADCATPLIEFLIGPQEVFAGDLIGKIETQHGGTRTYRVGEHDTNERCTK